MQNVTTFTQNLGNMENVGTPQERDNDRNRVLRHLENEGGLHLQRRLAPRALVRGRYEDEGGNMKLRLGRHVNYGTYLRLTLTVGEDNLLDVFLDMMYPYGMRNEEVVEKYGGLIRRTVVDHRSLCWTWYGFGYSCNDLTYCDVGEYVMPRSVGFGHHSPECPKTTRGSWHWCPEGPMCGKIAWALNLSVFESQRGEKVGPEKHSLQLRYILMNKDPENGEELVRIGVTLDGVFKGWLKSVDRSDAQLGVFNKDLLKLSAQTFVRCNRNWVHKSLPHKQEPYLIQIYKPPPSFTGAPRVSGDQDEQQTKMRCLLQLLNNSKSFNFSLFVQVLFDQLYVDASTLQFVECLQTLVNGDGDGQLQQLVRQLRSLPDSVPYRSLPAFPHILPILIRFLETLEVATTHGKSEAGMRKWPKALFEMVTTWTPERGCDICAYLPVEAREENNQFLRHYPSILLVGNASEEETLDVKRALIDWMTDTRTKLASCTYTSRCRYAKL